MRIYRWAIVLVVCACETADIRQARELVDHAGTGDVLVPQSMGAPQTPVLVQIVDVDPRYVSTSRLRFVRWLVARGARVDGEVIGGPSQGNTPLIEAANHGNVALVEALLDLGSDPNHHNSANGHAAVMSATKHRPVLELLLARGARLTERDLCGRSALHFAGMNADADTFNFLVDAGAVDTKDCKGDTAQALLEQHLEPKDMGAQFEFMRQIAERGLAAHDAGT
jgi:hypothetical protein